MKRLTHLWPLATAAILGACASNGSNTAAAEPAVLDDYPPEQTAGMQSQGQSERELLEGRQLDPIVGEPPQPRMLHFGFDQASVDSQYQEALRKHAEYLRNHPDAKLRLEGHADERGTREYNMALGERRALNVQKSLLLMGASASQLASVSYGEEQPRAVGRDQQSHQQNRRVELVYPQRTASANRTRTAANQSGR